MVLGTSHLLSLWKDKNVDVRLASMEAFGGKKVS